MDPSSIAQLLRPFTSEAELPPTLLEHLRLYLELLLKWNARVNLTAIRDPEQIVARHFGESLFAARLLFPQPPDTEGLTLADVGSGAGFPGIPIKLWASRIELTLIESQNKKATFLREVLRTLELGRVEVIGGRAEQWEHTADTITLRAVEKFDHSLQIAAGLVKPGGRLCLLIGANQLQPAQELLGQEWSWDEAHPMPQSTERVVGIAHRA